MLQVEQSNTCALDWLHVYLDLNERQCGRLPPLLKQLGQTLSGRLAVPSPMKLGSLGHSIKLSWFPLQATQLCGSDSSTVAVLMMTAGMLGSAGVQVITLIS